MAKKKKRKKWMKVRHRVITELARLVMHPFTVIRYGVKVEKFKGKPLTGAVIMDHQIMIA